MKIYDTNMAKWVSVFNGKLFLRFPVLSGCWKTICVSIIIQIIPWKWEAFLGPFYPVYSTVAVARPGTSEVNNTREEKCRWFAEVSYQIVAYIADGNFPVNTTQVKQVQLNSAFIRPASSSLLQSAFRLDFRGLSGPVNLRRLVSWTLLNSD